MQDFLSILPNLSIGVVSICGLVYVVLKFLEKMDALLTQYLSATSSASERHEKAMSERENQLRNVETHVRETLTTALTQNTIALTDAARVLGRVAQRLDGNN